ncbi:MAG: methyltransferase domain-containing protein [candidate division NC10 bacterium]|nr:methyltransferase domain-containing protein [candidate division NC10 bacterium]
MGTGEPWSERKARWYSEAQRLSDYPEKAMGALAPLLNGCRSVLDVGAGSGALSIPLAKVVEQVTALDPSPAMLKELKRLMEEEGLSNITCLEGRWGEVAVEPHDLLLVANVPGILSDVPGFVGQALRVANQAIAIIQHVGTGRDKFYFDELSPLLFGRPYPPREDYLITYIRLHRLGIHADVRILDYHFDQPFADLDEAVEFWKEHLHLEGNEHDETLREFLRMKLLPFGTGLLAPIPKRSAVISWPVRGERSLRQPASPTPSFFS